MQISVNGVGGEMLLKVRVVLLKTESWVLVVFAETCRIYVEYVALSKDYQRLKDL